MCVGKFHCECWSIPVEKIHYIDVVVLRHASYRVERFDNPSNSVWWCLYIYILYCVCIVVTVHLLSFKLN
jgi:hypothetical protein